MSTIYTYELLEMSWALDYDFQEEVTTSIVRDESNTGEEPSPDHVVNGHEQLPIVYDEEGIPMGKSMEEVRMRQEVILAFFRNFQKDEGDRKVYNKMLEDDILIRSISVTEAKEHSSKSYQSTKAVLRLDEVLAEAKPIRRMPVKAGNKNQMPFSYMLVMSCKLEGIGTVKLTVGVRQKNEAEKAQRIEYGVSVLPEGVTIDDEITETFRKMKKKKAHR